MSIIRKSSRIKSKTDLISNDDTNNGKIRNQRKTKHDDDDLEMTGDIEPNENGIVDYKIESTPPKQKKRDNDAFCIENLSPGSGAASLILKLKINHNSRNNDDKRDAVAGHGGTVGESPVVKNENKYHKARKILNTNETNKLPCRDKEYTELIDFLQDHYERKASGSIYISGPPGTGKTATLTKILNHSEIVTKFKKVYINCTSITSINNIYKDICEELKLDTKGKAAIEMHLTKTSHKMILLVLDEIDQLISKKQSILYSIFEWPSLENSRIILIGIANALDLTDRMLPRLNTKFNLKPKLMHFAPYTKQQIVEIFTDRLKDANVLELFPPVTIQLLAGKVAAVSGDVRRALDIGRRVIEITEKQKRTKTSRKQLNLNFNELGIEPLDDEKEDSTPATVELKQVVSVLNNVYGTSQNLEDDMEDSFPLQQKLLICALLLLLKHDKNKDITVGRLHDVYKRVCKKRNILAVDQSEFVGLCDLVQTRGILKVQKKKEPRQCKVSLEWDEEEVNQALRDKQLISNVLCDLTCLSR